MSSEHTDLPALVAACIEAIEQGEHDPVARLCGADAELAGRVRRRLQQLAARGLLPTTATVTLPATIGPYRVVAELGSGGMGAVYRAEQDGPVRREVAVKVIKLGMDTREVVARFEAERQALAWMNHPHIAQVFAAGATEDGRPWFAMELVPGEPITRYCDQRRLSVRARLQLFATVCRAVQHAHDKGVIHRDLKPSNLLVAEHQGQHQPKIIDFGIAKATGPQAEPGHTTADQVLGTPEYMSPEQADSGGLDVDIRTDVWSLGVVLYELLCGQLPLPSEQLRQAGRVGLRRLLHEAPLTSPSTRLRRLGEDAATTRATSARLLLRTVRGELDWIVQRALARDRAERYPSALAFAEDVERWLHHQPVLAGPPSLGYRLRKFVRRHRVPVAAGAVVLVALVTGLVVSLAATAEAIRARDQEAAARQDMRAFFDLSRDALGEMVQVADRELRGAPRLEPVRQAMLTRALECYQGLLQRRPTDPGLRLELARAQERTAAILRQLGRAPQALPVLQEGLATTDALLAGAADPIAVRQVRFTLLTGLQALHATCGRPSEAATAATAAHAELQQLLAAVTAPALRAELLASGAALRHNQALERDDDPEAATALLVQAIADYEQALQVTPGQRGWQLQLALCRVRHGELLSRRGDHAGAERAMRAAIARLQELPDDHSEHDRRTALATAQDRLATLLRRLDRKDEAGDCQRQALQLLRAVAVEHPDLAGVQVDIAGSLHFLADLQRDRGDLAAAITGYQEALAARQHVLAIAPGLPRAQLALAKTWFNLGGTQLQDLQQNRHGDLAGVAASFASAAAAIAAARREAPQDREVVAVFASTAAAAATVRGLQGEPLAAAEALRGAADELRQLVEQAPQQVDLRGHLARLRANEWLLRMRGDDADGALAAVTDGIAQALAGARLDPQHAEVQDCLPLLFARLATQRQKAGDLDGALAACRQLLTAEGAGPAARAAAAMLQAQMVHGCEDQAVRAAALPAAVAALQDQLAAASTPADALRRLQLRACLGELLGDQDAAAPRAAVLAVALDELRTLPTAPAELVRNLHTQAAEAALARDDLAAVPVLVEAMLARTGERGRAHYLAATLLAQVAARSRDQAEREACGARAVACLQQALQREEVPAAAARHANFAALRDRADYRALLDGR